MDIQIETQNVGLPKNAAVNLGRRVRKAMSHVGDNVSRLHLSLRDINGSKGGRDKICTIRATLSHGGEVVVVDRSENVRDALFSALRRTRATISRQMKRRRQRVRQRNLPPTDGEDLSARVWLESA